MTSESRCQSNGYQDCLFPEPDLRPSHLSKRGQARPYGNRSQDDDPGYAVFGVVREGMEIVQAVAQVPTSNDPLNRPLYEVHINSITLEGYVTTQVEPKKEEETSSISFSLSLLLISLVALRRK